MLLPEARIMLMAWGEMQFFPAAANTNMPARNTALVYRASHPTAPQPNFEVMI